MQGDEHIKDKSKNELLSDLYTHAQPGSVLHEQLKMGIVVRCTEDMQKSIDLFTKTNNRLSSRILWLNIILGIFTIVGTVLAVWQLLKK